MSSRGLGLISICERLQLVEERLFVKSEPGRGTAISAPVPLVSETTSPQNGRMKGEG